MERKTMKYFCIQPIPLLYIYTQQLQNIFISIATVIFVIYIVILLIKLIKKTKNIFRFSLKVLYFEIGLLIFIFYPIHNINHFIIGNWKINFDYIKMRFFLYITDYFSIYPIVIAYFLFGYLLLIKFKIFTKNKKVLLFIFSLFFLITVLLVIKVNENHLQLSFWCGSKSGIEIW